MLEAAGHPPRRGLGRGLEALVGGASHVAQLVHVPVEEIRPNARQPRRRHDMEAAGSLAESVRAQGILQPVVVRSTPGGGYELIAGERRWRAARDAGLPTVPAVVRESDDRESLLLALVENVAREQLTPVEEARAYGVLLDELGLSLGDLAARVGRSKPTVSNRLRLLELPDDVLELVETGRLSEGHGRALLAVPEHEERRRLARRAVRNGLSVRSLERAAREAGARTRQRRAGSSPALRERATEALRRLTGREARVVAGRVEVPFSDDYELEEIVESLERAAAAPPNLA